MQFLCCESRHHRYSALNNIIHRALTTAGIPSRLEPAGVSRVDGKRRDGITVVPWKQRKLLVLDATCSDTFASFYVDDAARGVGNVATAAEARKKAKYSHLVWLSSVCTSSHRDLGGAGA